MNIYLSLTSEEIIDTIPYGIVCEVMSGSKWNTGRRKRLMKEQFSETERNAISRLHQQARTWYLYKGVPEELLIKPTTIDLWTKLANFCYEL